MGFFFLVNYLSHQKVWVFITICYCIRLFTVLACWKECLTSVRYLKMVKNLPTMQDTRVQSLGQEDPLEKEMATHSSILARRIPWTEESGGLQSMGLRRVGYH